MNIFNIRFYLTLLLVSLISLPSLSDSYFDAGESKISIISESKKISSNDKILIGIEFDLMPGWHTYWKNPGDSGQEASIEWTLPKGFVASEILWPGPERIPVEPLMTYGYENKVVLLTEIKSPKDFPEEVNLAAKISWLTCKEICIPQEGKVDINLIRGQKLESRDAFRLRNVLETVPKKYPYEYRASLLNEKIFLNLKKNNDVKISQAYFFPYDYGLIDYSAEQKLENNQNSFGLEIEPSPIELKTNNLKGVLELGLEGSSKFYELSTELEQIAESKPIKVTLITAIIFAFLGGIILNAMPCVFPILSIKILSFIEQSQGSKEKLILHGLVFSAGVLSTFLLMAALLISLRVSGEAIGWGYQLQSPLVVSLLIYLFVIVGIVFMGNLVLGSSLTRLGVFGKNQRSLLSSFLTGTLAVIVASPCTAPFMGPALGVALLQPGMQSIAIFLSLGLGFSFPYLLLSFSPGLLSKLPKPGEWMLTLKQLMAFPMWASALWLAWVLSSQVSTISVFLVLLGSLLIALALWLVEKSQASKVTLKRLSLMSSLVLIVTAIWLLPYTNDDNETALKDGQNAFSAQKLSLLRSEQKIVFINFTADWCITCKVNEAIALNQKEVKNILQQKGITYLKADWTRKDEEIASILERYGRTGVPLYLLFPSVGDPIILPEILTEELLLDFLNKIN